MAIIKAPKRVPDSETTAKAFIAKTGRTPQKDKTPVLFRFRKEFLDRIDAAAKKHELPRQAWVRTVIVQALEAEGF